MDITCTEHEQHAHYLNIMRTEQILSVHYMNITCTEHAQHYLNIT